jgi:hypothetical protein
MITNAYAQKLVNKASVRILITASDAYGRLRPESDRSSSAVLYHNVKGWEKSPVLKVRDNLQTNLRTIERSAWIFSKGQTRIAALQHEWGVELLPEIVAGVTATGIIELTRLFWRRWQNQKKATRSKEQSVLRFQIKEEGKGNVRTKTIEYSGNLNLAQVDKIMEDGFKLVQKDE